jgi:hypothetical protein
MPISVACADEHIRSHCTRLRRFGSIRDWPRYVIHTAHVDTAVKILKSDHLLPREQVGALAHDVANPYAIATNPEAWRYARLYFRPKTAFHLRTEGIKFATDRYRYESHMSIPIMLAFDARSVLTLDGVGFSNGKLARLFATPEFDEHIFGPYLLSKSITTAPLLIKAFKTQGCPRSYIREPCLLIQVCRVSYGLRQDNSTISSWRRCGEV